MVNHHHGANPLRCLDCGFEVDPESLPVPEDLVQDVADWRETDAVVQRYAQSSGPLQAWALEELHKFDSPLNRIGRAIQVDEVRCSGLIRLPAGQVLWSW